MGNINAIPVISQVKSLVQVIGGNAKGAKETQESFLRTAPLFSEVNTIIHLANGNVDEAKKIQKEYFDNLISIVDDTPVLGHVKGTIHILAGDEERGLQIINGEFIYIFKIYSWFSESLFLGFSKEDLFYFL